MKLHERLTKLIGHEVIVRTRLPDSEENVPPGNLDEVGEDYILIKTESEEKGGFANEGADCSMPQTFAHFVSFKDKKEPGPSVDVDT